MQIENKKIALYIPWLTRSNGGAEVYGLLMAEILEKKNKVTIISYQPEDKSFDMRSVFRKYGVKPLEVSYVSFWNINHLVGTQVWYQMKQIAKGYDLFINCSQGKMRGLKPIPSVHLIHFPDKCYKGLFSSVLNQRYLSSYHGFLCNSEYTKGYLKEYWGVDGIIVYPPISMKPIDEEGLAQKEKIILAVDRLVREKKILEMINAFHTICDQTNSGYRFVIIGNMDQKEMDYYNEIQNAIGQYPIEVYHDMDKEELVGWYRRASIFWHAKGYQEDEDPEKAEHFGMTTAEAMANGCIPVVINKAGQKEIVRQGVDGYLWDDLEELISFTMKLMKKTDEWKEMQMQAVASSKRYLIDAFEESLHHSLHEIMVN